MYDYETIKRNFEGNTKMLSHKEMCAKMGEKYNSNPAQIERQRERWKQIISWKYNQSKKSYYAIKLFSEEEIVFNLIESSSKDKLSYAMCAFLLLYSDCTDDMVLHTSFAELERSMGFINEKFNVARFNPQQAQFDCETELLSLQNSRHLGLEENKKAIRLAREKNPNGISLENKKPVNDFFSRYSGNAKDRIIATLNELKKNKVLNYREAQCGGFIDLNNPILKEHLDDVYCDGGSWFYLVKTVNENGEEKQTRIFVPYADRLLSETEEAKYLNIQNKYSRELGYRDYGKACEKGAWVEVNKKSQKELRETLGLLYVRPALSILFSPSGLSGNQEYYKKSLQESFSIPFLNDTVQETNKLEQKNFFSNLKKRQEAEIPENKKKIGSKWSDSVWEDLRKTQAMYTLVQKKLAKEYLDVTDIKYLPEIDSGDCTEIVDYMSDGVEMIRDNQWLKVFDNSNRRRKNYKETFGVDS